MPVAIPGLLERIEAFEIDGDSPCSRPFLARLAEENCWTTSYAARAIAEYKRFVYLAVTEAAEVTPSDFVDRVWHLHLIYTHSYWERFCPEVLGQALHHIPSKGGTGEAARHAAQYRNTIAAYRRTFDADPPADIWPQTKQPLRNGRLIGRKFAAPMLLACLAAVIAGCANRNAPTARSYTLSFWSFLGLACVGYFVALAAALRLRAVLSRPVEGASVGEDIPDLRPEDIAYLTGAHERVLGVVLAKLWQAGTLRLDAGRERFTVAAPLPADASPVEREVYDWMNCGRDSSRTVSSLRREVGRAYGEAFSHLEKSGLTVPQSRAMRAWTLPILLVFAYWGLVVLTGITISFFLGVLEFPGFVQVVCAIVLAIGGFALWVVLFKSPPYRTARGSRALRECRTRRWQKNGDTTLAMRVALAGTIVLKGTELEPLIDVLQPPPRTSGGGGAGGSSCSGGGGCSGSSCGGGGCGGG